MEAPPATILHVDAESGFSGGEVQVFHLMRGLSARGWPQVLVAPPGSAALAAAQRELDAGGFPGGLELHPVAMRNNLDFSAVVKLRKSFRAQHALDPEQPLVVQLHTGRATWLGAWAAAGLGLAVVSTRRMDRRVKRSLGTRLLYRRLVDHVVAISGPVRDGLSASGVPAERLSVIHSSVNPGELIVPDATRGRAELRAELGATNDDFCLLVLARLDRRKGLDVLLDALARLRVEAGLDALRARNTRAAVAARRGEAPEANPERFAEAHPPKLWIAGEGPERVALEAQCAKLELDASVSFLGRRADKAELLNAADALVLPSRFEGLGVAALEAMAAGRAVIATRVGGLAEAVIDERTGLLVEPEDERALAAAIGRLAGDPALTARLANAGPARIEEAYRVSLMVAGYASLYRQLLRAQAP